MGSSNLSIAYSNFCLKRGRFAFSIFQLGLRLYIPWFFLVLTWSIKDLWLLPPNGSQTSGSNFMYVICSHGKVWRACCSQTEGGQSWRIIQLIDQSELMFNHPVLYAITFFVYSLISPTGGVSVKVSNCHPIFRFG